MLHSRSFFYRSKAYSIYFNIVLKSSSHSAIGKLQDLWHVLHDVLAASNDNDIILLVKQENIQSVQELTTLVLETEWGRDVDITEGGNPRPLRDISRNTLYG